MDERIRRIVMSHPIPDRLIHNLSLAPLQDYPRRRYARGRSGMTPVLWETLKLVAAGYTTPRIAQEFDIPFYTAQDRVKRLLAYFDARDRIDIVVRCYREGIL